MRRARRDYFDWLCDYISIPGVRTSDYISVLKFIYTMPFIAVHVRDINRIKDAINLRNEFNNEMDIVADLSEETDASVLEVLVALSIRCERDIIGEPGSEMWGRLFWEMLHNLKIDVTNDRFAEDEIEEKVDNWMRRNYKFDGTGGIFPLRKKPQIDQTEVEIWYQMQSYISEDH
jgi:hypothetical protein